MPLLLAAKHLLMEIFKFFLNIWDSDTYLLALSVELSSRWTTSATLLENKLDIKYYMSVMIELGSILVTFIAHAKLLLRG